MGLISMPGVAITHEDLSLGFVRMDYVEGRIDLDEFERAVDFILDGGFIAPGGRVPVPRGTTYLAV